MTDFTDHKKDSNMLVSGNALDSLELLYEVGREFAAALELRTVLHRVLFLSMKYVGANSGSIIVIDDAGQPMESAFLITGRTHDHTALQLKVTYEHGMAGWVARHRQAVVIADTSKDERWLRLPDDAVERTGPKSAVSVPIVARDSLVGVITLVHPQPGFFGEQHLDLVQAIADQAGISIQNARLYEESQRQAQVMTAVVESAAVISASLQLQEVFDPILVQIKGALRVEGASIALMDPDGKKLQLSATTFESVGDVVGKWIPVDEGIWGWVAQHGEGVIVNDTQKDKRFKEDVQVYSGLKPRATICAPIRSEDQVIGIVEAINPFGDVFNVDDLLFLTGVGNMAGSAIRHAQLFELSETAQRRYHDLFEDSIDPIILSDWQGNVLEVNRRAKQVIGINEGERGLRIELLHELNWDSVGDDFESLKSGNTITYETILHPLFGNSIPVQVYVHTVRNEKASQLQWIFRDISERKHLDAVREDLIAMVYHDLRSPLANVVSSLEMLDAMVDSVADNTTQSLISIATRSTERIQRLTNTLLDISQLEAGQTIGNRQMMPPRELALEALDAVLPAAEHKGQKIQVDASRNLPSVWVDEDMIRRVLINLLENAIKFTPPEGKIYMGAQYDAGFVRYWIQDTGPGISSEDQEWIFEKFKRHNSPTSPRGLGLGLAYCKLAVNGHGGRIWVESQTGSGAKFLFSLPVEEDGISSTGSLEDN